MAVGNCYGASRSYKQTLEQTMNILKAIKNWFNREHDLHESTRCKELLISEQRQCLNVTRYGNRCWRHD